MHRRRLRWLRVCFLFLLGATFLRADVTGSIQGYVRDSAGAVLPNAHVVLTDVATNLNRETTTNAQGLYSFLAMPPGRYRIVVGAPGFKQSSIDSIDLTVNDQLRFDVTLAVGRVQQQVTVQANTLQVQTQSTEIGNTLESKQIESMPLNGRSYLDLFALQAGVAPVTSGTVPADREVSGLFTNAGNLSVDGQPETANAFLVNGGDVSETKNMGAGLIPTLDSIQEFRVITNSYSAEYGKFTGAVMNVVTKSGTNSIHGDAYEFFRNQNFDARNYFDPDRIFLHRNQFGYAVGGPFWKNKLFWFTDYQGTLQTQGASTGSIQLPTNAERAGMFTPAVFSGPGGPNLVGGAAWAATLSQRLGYAVANGEPYSLPGCTTTAQCVFPGGVIPQPAFDRVAVNELKYIPTANIDPATGLYANSSARNTVTDNNMGQRVDFNNQKTGDWSFYYHFDDSTFVNQLGGQAYIGAAPLPGFPTSEPSRNQMFVVSNTKPIGTSAVNVARATFFRTSVHTAQPGAASTVSLASLGFTTGLGSLGIVPSGPAGYPESLPPDNFNNYSIGNNWLNLFQVDNNYMVSDNVAKTMNSQTLRFGGEYRYYQLNVRNICGPNGYFVFNGTETGLDFADFLLGAPAQYVQCTEQFLNNRARYGGLFVQDDWKVKSNLTVNAGIRYEVATPWSDSTGMLNTVIPGVQSVKFPTAPLGYLVPGDPGVPGTISPTEYDTFAPRVGAAYSPNPSGGILNKIFGNEGDSSIRAAYGLFYLGAPDLGNFGVIGDAPWGLYWQSTAPPLLETPFETRSTGQSQGQRFPFTFPSTTGTHPNFNFAQYLPLNAPAYNTNNKLTYTEQYNLTFQRQLSRTTVATIAYVGTQSHRLLLNDNIIVGSAALCNQLNAEGATPACGPGAESSVFTLPGGKKIYGTMVGQLNNQALGPKYNLVPYGTINLMSTIGHSSYNSLQASIERRSRDLTFLVAYTYGKSLDNVNTTLNVLDPQTSYVISPFDVKHNLVASYAWTIPFDRAFSSLSPRITQGWTLTGISRFATGFPVTLSQSGDISLTNLGIDFPNVVGPIVKQNPRNPGPTGPNQFFLPSAFSTELPGVVGDAPARYFAGPGIINTDAGFMKTTNIFGSRSLVLRAEFFNIFNHSNFTTVVGNFSSSQFGQATQVMPARVGQLSVKFLF